MENQTACLLAQEIGLAIAANREEGLRDQFAMAALTGILANSEPGTLPESESSWVSFLPKMAYRYADAMMAARKAEGK